MLKNISNLGAQLSKNEQKGINGGARNNVCAGRPDGSKCYMNGHKDCPGYCFGGVCNPW